MAKKLICILYIILLNLTIHAQCTNAQREKLMLGYITDGQSYTLNLIEEHNGKAYVTFIESFAYRIIICSSNTKKYKVKLFDIQKKELFSGSCDSYTKTIDLQFKSNTACYIEIITNEEYHQNCSFAISIGFKEGIAIKK